MNWSEVQVETMLKGIKSDVMAPLIAQQSDKAHPHLHVGTHNVEKEDIKRFQMMGGQDGQQMKTGYLESAGFPALVSALTYAINGRINTQINAVHSQGGSFEGTLDFGQTVGKAVEETGTLVRNATRVHVSREYKYDARYFFFKAVRTPGVPGGAAPAQRPLFIIQTIYPIRSDIIEADVAAGTRTVIRIPWPGKGR